MGLDLNEMVEKTIDEVKINNEVAFDVGSLAFMNNEKKNAEAVASYLLEVGLYEEYNGLLKSCKLLSIEKELERIKSKNNSSAYLAIAEFLEGEDYEYAKKAIFEEGSDYDRVKFFIKDKKSDKVEMFRQIYNCKNRNALGYLLKYLSDEDFERIVITGDLIPLTHNIAKYGNKFAEKELNKKQDKILKRLSVLDMGRNGIERCKV